MDTKKILTMFLFALLAGLLVACSRSPEFSAPEIDPPQDLIPDYVPEGFELVSGFQLPGEITGPARAIIEGCPIPIRMRALELKSPHGHDIQGVHYQGEDTLLLISKSDFAEGSLEEWIEQYETGEPQPCECDCLAIRLNGDFPTDRFIQHLETRTIAGTQVAILKDPNGWITVFVLEDELITVQSGISLEENLKVVTSLIQDR